MSYVLFNETMKFNPKNPDWFNRDRFVLSAGHGSMLQYALLHLLGYDSVSVRVPGVDCLDRFVFVGVSGLPQASP